MTQERSFETLSHTPRVVYGSQSLAAGSVSIDTAGTGISASSTKLVGVSFYLCAIAVVFRVTATGALAPEVQTIAVTLDSAIATTYDMPIFDVVMTGQSSIYLPRDDVRWAGVWQPMFVPNGTAVALTCTNTGTPANTAYVAFYCIY